MIKVLTPGGLNPIVFRGNQHMALKPCVYKLQSQGGLDHRSELDNCAEFKEKYISGTEVIFHYPVETLVVCVQEIQWE